jgi:uncharacterized protein YcsI (UPF0317 family)
MHASRPSRSSDTRYPDGNAVRLAARSGQLTRHTSGLAPGFVQGNLVILPAALAREFLQFCQQNPKPCPLIGISEVGSPHIPRLGRDLDLRTDIPKYCVWKNGQLVDEPISIAQYWRDDLVGFVIGCSFTFEEALVADGIELRHVKAGANVAMFKTDVQTEPAGPFSGPLVVSMRPLKPRDAIRAVQITSRYPAVHGAPVHIGLPTLIGIQDVNRPDYGDATQVLPDELPVFWACGVTPQAVIAAARPEFAITHAPGCMLVTDLRNNDFAII